MAGLDDRREAAENRYAYEEELKFRIKGRRNRYLGDWAAALMGKSGDEASAYALDVATRRYPGPGEASLVERIRNDLEAAGVAVTEAEVAAQLPALQARATADISGG